MKHLILTAAALLMLGTSADLSMAQRRGGREADTVPRTTAPAATQTPSATDDAAMTADSDAQMKISRRDYASTDPDLKRSIEPRGTWVGPRNSFGWERANRRARHHHVRHQRVVQHY